MILLRGYNHMETTFLTEKQIWGDDQGNGQLQAMKGYGTKTGMSDLAIVLGGYMGTSKTSDGQRTGYVWSASSHENGNVRTVGSNGDRSHSEPSRRDDGARPALPSSVTSKIQTSEASPTRKIAGVNGTEIQVKEYGEYPQTIADEDVAKELNGLSEVQLKKMETGKKYTFDGENYDAYDKPFNAKEYAEYQYKGENYIRVEAQPHGESFLSNGNKVEKDEICWIKAQPIEWLVDPTGVWVARQALFSGVQFDRNNTYGGNFENTDMKHYLDTYFSKEMMANRNVGTPAVPEPSTADFAARMAIQRQRALDDPSQGL